MYSLLKKTLTNLCFSLCRGENQLEEGKDIVHLDVAVCSDLGSVSHSGLGPVRAGALWPVLFTCLGTDETQGLLFCHLLILLQPGHAQCHHHLLLLWHRYEALFHLQKIRKQQPRAQYCQTPPEAVNSKLVSFNNRAVILVNWGLGTLLMANWEKSNRDCPPKYDLL